MISTALGLLLALVFTASATPLVRRLALRLHAVDEPTARRVHSRSIPRSGGVAIVFGFFGALLVLFLLQTDAANALQGYPKLLIGLVVGSLTVATLGVFDDVVGVRAKTKLAIQVVAAVAAYAAGFRIGAIHLPLVGAIQLGYFALPVTVLWICGVINALNLIDGLDGLAAGVAFFACVANFVIALVSGNVLICLLSATLGGAIVGFLFYNFNPATIFMGDSGSMFLGYVLATVSLFGAGSHKGGTAIAIVVPILALGVPILDMVVAMARRFLSGRSIFSADRGHIHHRLLDMGLTHRRAVLVLYALCVLFTTGALAVYIGRSWQVGLSLAALVAGVIGVAHFVGYFNQALSSRHQRYRQRTADVEALRRTMLDAIRALERVSSAPQLGRALEEFALSAGLVSFDLTIPSDSGWHWKRPELSDRQMREVVRSRYTLQLANQESGEVVFAWDSELGEVSPQADILLQVVSDALEHSLGRVLASPHDVSAKLAAADDSGLSLGTVNS